MLFSTSYKNWKKESNLAVIVTFLYFGTILSEAIFPKRQSLELKRFSAEFGHYYFINQ